MQGLRCCIELALSETCHLSKIISYHTLNWIHESAIGINEVKAPGLLLGAVPEKAEKDHFFPVVHKFDASTIVITSYPKGGAHRP
jgi:hypothetical protein